MIENPDTRILYLLPGKGQDHNEQFNDCLAQLEHILDASKRIREGILKLTVFIDVTMIDEYIEIKRNFLFELKRFFGNFSLPVSFVSQPPVEKKHLVAIETILADLSGDAEIHHKIFNSTPYTVYERKGYRELYCAGITSGCNGNMAQNVKEAFIQMRDILKQEGFCFSNVVRQWGFIENIIGINEGKHQNYQIFNKIRSKFYSGEDFNWGYPAATAIGMNTGGVILEFIALLPCKNEEVIPLRNPLQVDAHNYSEMILLSGNSNNQDNSFTPKFERGKFVKLPFLSRLFVSGTASIIDEKTEYAGDLEKQTGITINNIFKLISNAVPRKFNSSTKFSYIRIYVKNAEGINCVREICERRFNSEHFQFLIADVCRENLLVEIEGCIDK